MLLVSGFPRQVEGVLMDEALRTYSVGTKGVLQMVEGSGFESLILYPLTHCPSFLVLSCCIFSCS